MGIDLKNPKPLYLQISEDLASQITSGKLKIGEQLPSQQKLSGIYGVSLITIKKALAHLVNLGILFTRVGKGTFIARESVPDDVSRHKLIGIVLSDLRNPFFSLILDSIEKKSSAYGYTILFANSADEEEREESQIKHFLRLGVDGIIIASTTHDYRANHTIRKLHERSFPYVMISYVADKDIYFVGVDHEKGGFIATQHLIQCGYDNIGYINGEEGNLLGYLRKGGYLRALDAHGKPLQPDYIYQLTRNGNDYQAGYRIGKHFRELRSRPEAIFAYKDLVALGFEQAVMEDGLKVPDDVAIVGFDDIENDLYAPVPLTTVHQPVSEIGAIAVESVIRRIEGSPVTTRTILEPKLVIRKSCGKAK